MKPSDVAAFAKVMGRHQIPFILVGGAAVQHFLPSSTRDVDVLVLSKAYRTAADALDHDPSVVAIAREPGSFVSGTFFSGGTLVRFDLLDAAAYSGDLKGEEFYAYVERYQSERREGIVVARPCVVWFMRLAIQDWRTYVPKVLQDLLSGAQDRWLDDAIAVAHKFGMGALLTERVKEVREAARLLGLGERHLRSAEARGSP